MTYRSVVFQVNANQQLFVLIVCFSLFFGSSLFFEFLVKYLVTLEDSIS